MSKKRQISYSGYNTYHQCPKKFQLHYEDGYRTNYIGSALVFGSMVDFYLNHLLEGTPAPAFEYQNDWIIWDKIDYAPKLLNEEQIEYALKYAEAMGYTLGVLDPIMDHLFKKMGKNGCRFLSLMTHEQKMLDVVCKICIEAKVKLIIDKYKTSILPRLSNIQKVQHPIDFQGIARGFTDFVAEYDGKLIIFDNKTSKYPYMENSVAQSMQLALYANVLNLDYGGYIVMLKDFSRGEAKIQLIFDKIPTKMKEMTKDAIIKTHEAVNSKIYPPNLSACNSMFGRRCDFYDLCHRNDDSLLTKVEPNDSRK